MVDMNKFIRFLERKIIRGDKKSEWYKDRSKWSEGYWAGVSSAYDYALGKVEDMEEMELFDKDGNKYIAKGAVLKKEVDLKEKYESLFKSKRYLYKKYYVEAIGDKWDGWYRYYAKKWTNTSVCFERGGWSEGWNHSGYLTFQIADLEGSDENFIKLMKERAIRRLKQESGTTRSRLNQHTIREEEKILKIQDLIDKIGGRNGLDLQRV